MPGSANLNIMLKTARLVGRSLSKDFREVENLQVSRKGVGDFVSRADIAAENIIRNELCLLYTSPSPRDKRQSRMPSSA